MAEQIRAMSGRPRVFGMGNDLCVWSRAGVVKPIKCMNAFDCLGCSFDRKVQADFEAREKTRGAMPVEAGKTRLRLLINQRKCRHMLSGRVAYKLCGHSYNCVRCPYDQMLEDTAVLQGLNPPACDSASGFNLAHDYYYHHGHTWARVEYGGSVRIGVDDFAMRLLGPQDEIQLPKLGDSVSQGQPHARLVRGQNEAEPLSPVDGKVVAINRKVATRAATANDSPYQEGWLMVIQPNNLRRNLKNLLFGSESTAWMDDEASRLTTMLSEATGYRLAATGGEMVRDIYGAVPGIDWSLLVQEFLR
jgi:glycine cleavage system H lipoate-binding protein